MKETLCITISRGSIAKNLLGTEFYETLRARFRLVILTPAYNDPRFLSSFSREGVTFLPLIEPDLSTFESFLFFFHKHLIYNSTVNQKVRWGIIGDPRSKRNSYVTYFFLRHSFLFLSRFRLLRRFVKYLDYRCTQRSLVSEYEAFLRHENVRGVVATNVSDNAEAALIKAASRVGVVSIGFPKSWDNLSKHAFRANPDYLVVWNDFMKEQTLKFHDYREERVIPVGVPQYDFNFKDDMEMSREEFCHEYRLDPQKRIIVFGSEGKLFPSDARVASHIGEMVQNGELGLPSQLLIRPHYGYKHDEKKFDSVIVGGGVVVDTKNTPSAHFRDQWDYSDEFTRRFVNTMRHADVLVTTASTLMLDAVCFGARVVLIAYDGEERARPYPDSVERWYETHYYRKILTYNAAPLVRSKVELKAELVKALRDLAVREKERVALRNDFTFRYDGGSGKRFGEAVILIVAQSI